MNHSAEMVVIIRPSFMKFCGDGCRAAAFNHALYWIAQKAKGQPKEKVCVGLVTWYGTTEEIAEGLAGAWGVCKVRQEMNALIDMGIIGLGKNPRWGAGRTKHFFFGPEQCTKLLVLCEQHQICLLHIGLKDSILDLLRQTSTDDKSIICHCPQTIALSDTNDEFIEIQTSKSSDTNDRSIRPSDKSIETYTKDVTKVSSKDNLSKDTAKRDSLLPATPPPSSFSLEEETVLGWLKEKAIPRRAKDVTTVKDQLATIRERIQTKETLHKYCEYAIEQYRGRKNPVVALGNLASQTLLDAFMQAQETEQSFIPTQIGSEPEPASQGDFDALLIEMQSAAPDLVIEPGQDDEGAYISLRWGPGQHEYVAVRDREEWEMARGDQWVMSRARKYAEQQFRIAG